MNPAEVRFSDQHVRQHPELAQQAIHWLLRCYNGDWPVMLDLREIVEEGGVLNVAQLRTVLNTMRHDPTVQFAPLPPPETVVVGRRLVAVPPATTDLIERTHRAARSEFTVSRAWQARSYRHKLKTRWPRRWAISTAQPHKVRTIHLIDPERSSMGFWPARAVRPEGWWHVQVRWICSGHITSAYEDVDGRRVAWPKLKLLNTKEAFALLAESRKYGDTWRFCAACSRTLRNRLERTAAR